MSQTGPHAQWKTGTNGVTAIALGYLVESGGRYTLSETGPADAYLSDTGDGRLHIATTGDQDGTIYALEGATRFQILT